jgi:transposase-like protein
MFPDEDACAAYLEGVRWPDGFVCPYCSWRGKAYRITTRPTVLQCHTCQRQMSLTSGTVMERSHTVLRIWFWGAYLVSSHTPGMSALQFQRQLGLARYETAFQMLHKLRAGMVRPNRDRIGDQWPVEIDETLVGGRTRGEGRGVHHKAIVVGAVEVRRGKAERAREPGAARPRRGGTYAGRLRLRISPDRGKVAMEQFVTENVATGSHVTTDGWQGYDNLVELGYRHEKIVMDGDPENAEAWLPMIHLVFSNLKTWLQGTHHGVSQQHLQAYLNEFTFRFNRRFWPFNAFNSLLGISVTAEAPTYEGLYSGGWVHPNVAAQP